VLILYLEEVGKNSKAEASEVFKTIDEVLIKDDVFRRIPYGINIYLMYME
jgi:hypothetical protein